MRKGLQIRIVKNRLVISLPIKVLSWAFEHSDKNNPYDTELHNFRRDLKVLNDQEFAKDVISELNKEWEDGSTPLTMLLDQMCQNAVENGSMAVEEDGREHDELLV